MLSKKIDIRSCSCQGFFLKQSHTTSSISFYSMIRLPPWDFSFPHSVASSCKFWGLVCAATLPPGVHTHIHSYRTVGVNPFAAKVIKEVQYCPGSKDRFLYWNQTIFLSSILQSWVRANVRGARGLELCVTSTKTRLFRAQVVSDVFKFGLWEILHL